MDPISFALNIFKIEQLIILYRNQSQSELLKEIQKQLQKMLLNKILQYGKTQKFVGKKQRNMLGEGGYSKVYIYEYKNKDCAVKVVDKSRLSKQGLKKVVSYEHGSLQKLKNKSQNIIQLYHFQEDQRYIYYFLELCTKGTLRNLVQSSPNKRLSQKQAIKCIYQLVQGCWVLHTEKIIHRDIKPDNIFVTEQNVIKIGDFGFAKYVNYKNEGDIRCTPVGTGLYKSPQILESNPKNMDQWVHFTQKCDIWDIGMVFFYLLFGVTPWQHYLTDKKAELNHQQYLKLIKQFPIQQIVRPHPLLPQANSFITRCLQYSQQSRASYHQLKSHPIFKHVYLDKLLTQLKYILLCQQTTIQQILASLKIENVGHEKLSYEKLTAVLKMISKGVDTSKCRLVYQGYGGGLTVGQLVGIFNGDKEKVVGNLQNVDIEKKQAVNNQIKVKVQQQVGKTGLKQMQQQSTKQNRILDIKKRQN